MRSHHPFFFFLNRTSKKHILTGQLQHSLLYSLTATCSTLTSLLHTNTCRHIFSNTCGLRWNVERWWLGRLLEVVGEGGGDKRDGLCAAVIRAVVFKDGLVACLFDSEQQREVAWVSICVHYTAYANLHACWLFRKQINVSSAHFLLM